MAVAVGLTVVAAAATSRLVLAQGVFPPPPPPGQAGVFPAPPAPGQQGGGMVGTPPTGGGGNPFAGGGGPPQMPPQCAPFPKLRDEAARRAELVQKIGKGHGDRKAMCEAVTKYVEAEGRVVKFLEDNKTACGVPAETVQQAKLGHANTLKFREQVCAEGPKPKVPTLSDAIGTPTVETPKDPKKTGVGTYDTLTGNPLNR
jgi:hypothetical protein